MKLCPHCGAANDDKVLYCVECMKPLPSPVTLDYLRREGMAALNSGDIRRAEEKFSRLISLNPGDREAGALAGVLRIKLGLIREGWSLLEDLNLAESSGRCPSCRGTGRCPTCEGEDICIMCRGTRRCAFCGGRGLCPSCGDSGGSCAVCGGIGTCPRCGGSGECSYCSGTGRCYTCHGTGLCPSCGGSGVARRVKYGELNADVAERVRRLLEG